MLRGEPPRRGENESGQSRGARGDPRPVWCPGGTRAAAAPPGRAPARDQQHERQPPARGNHQRQGERGHERPARWGMLASVATRPTNTSEARQRQQHERQATSAARPDDASSREGEREGNRHAASSTSAGEASSTRGHERPASQGNGAGLAARAPTMPGDRQRQPRRAPGPRARRGAHRLAPCRQMQRSARRSHAAGAMLTMPRARGHRGGCSPGDAQHAASSAPRRAQQHEPSSAPRWPAHSVERATSSASSTRRRARPGQGTARHERQHEGTGGRSRFSSARPSSARRSAPRSHERPSPALQLKKRSAAIIRSGPFSSAKKRSSKFFGRAAPRFFDLEGRSTRARSAIHPTGTIRQVDRARPSCPGRDPRADLPWRWRGQGEIHRRARARSPRAES